MPQGDSGLRAERMGSHVTYGEVHVFSWEQTPEDQDPSWDEFPLGIVQARDFVASTTRIADLKKRSRILPG